MKKLKRVPSFWWDFDADMRIMIESNDPDHPIITYCSTITDAEQFLADLKAGRRNHRT